VFVSVPEFSIKIVCSLRQCNILEHLTYVLEKELVDKEIKIKQITIHNYKLNPSDYLDNNTRLILDNDELVVSLKIKGEKRGKDYYDSYY
jgi:hypothetical protein